MASQSMFHRAKTGQPWWPLGAALGLLDCTTRHAVCPEQGEPTRRPLATDPLVKALQFDQKGR